MGVQKSTTSHTPLSSRRYQHSRKRMSFLLTLQHITTPATVTTTIPTTTTAAASTTTTSASTVASTRFSKKTQVVGCGRGLRVCSTGGLSLTQERTPPLPTGSTRGRSGRTERAQEGRRRLKARREEEAEEEEEVLCASTLLPTAVKSRERQRSSTRTSWRERRTTMQRRRGARERPRPRAGSLCRPTISPTVGGQSATKRLRSMRLKLTMTPRGSPGRARSSRTRCLSPGSTLKELTTRRSRTRSRP
mmetsp:Transcript_48541/g.152240  ORF Transcript_48541/g.152240 Transcript_48541/m.152240 type:complete len:248 (-) Transcript_48541:1319-2062(-)